jgi:hypothetical protein
MTSEARSHPIDSRGESAAPGPVRKPSALHNHTSPRHSRGRVPWPSSLTLSTISALHALIKQWQLRRSTRIAPAPLADAAQTTTDATEVGHFTALHLQRRSTMNVNMKSSRRIASLILLSVVLASCASGPNAPPSDLQQRIEGARTRGDHQALATYYDQQATAARTSAAEHRKMGSSYTGNYAGGRGGTSMSAHCNEIVRSQESIAAQYEGMAAGHRQMAEQAKP